MLVYKIKSNNSLQNVLKLVCGPDSLNIPSLLLMKEKILSLYIQYILYILIILYYQYIFFEDCTPTFFVECEVNMEIQYTQFKSFGPVCISTFSVYQ